MTIRSVMLWKMTIRSVMFWRMTIRSVMLWRKDDNKECYVVEEG